MEHNEAREESDDERLRTYERLASVAKAVAELAHEIKNPLSAITTFVQLVPERYDDGEFRELFVRTALAAASRINHLVEELADLARPMKLLVEETDLREVIEDPLLEVHQQLAEKEILLTRDLPQEPLVVPVDREQFRRVILELLANSIDAVEKRGNVTISARFVGSAAGGAAREVEVAVSDDGCGISAENLERVFEPFFTTSDEKIGLGLAVARRIVQEHGGTIRVKSQPGRGATFLVRLKAGANASSSPESRAD